MSPADGASSANAPRWETVETRIIEAQDALWNTHALLATIVHRLLAVRGEKGLDANEVIELGRAADATAGLLYAQILELHHIDDADNA